MNVDAVARRSLAAVGGQTDAGVLLVGAWVSQRYQELCSRGYLRHLRQINELSVPPIITAGTVSVTQGSNEVRGDTTAIAAWAAVTGNGEGWFIRPTIIWFEVDGLDLANNRLLLKTDYTEATNATASYRLAHRFLPLDPSVRWLGDFVHMRRRRRVDMVSLEVLNAMAPDRYRTTAGGPYVWAEATPSADGLKRIEVYPYSDRAELVAYVFWKIPPALELDDDLPPALEWDVLLDGTLIDIYRYNAAQAARGDKIEAAAYWRNEYRAQETRWERRIVHGLRTDAAVDDVTMILESLRVKAVPDITTARDIVLDRWPL